MTINKIITFAILACLPLTVSADAYQDQKAQAEADFDLEFGGCDAKIAKQQSQIEQLKIDLEDFNSIESDRQVKINMLQNQLANQSSDVSAQLNQANQQTLAYSNALSEQKLLNNKLVSQINILKLKLANNNSTIRPLLTQTVQTIEPLLDSGIDIVQTWDDALWNWTAKNRLGQLGQDFAYVCPKNGRISTVIGTDRYGLRSSVCSAAVHAGLITVKSGGKVIFRIGGNKSSLTGSYRNDVSSKQHKWKEDHRGHFTFPTLKK